MGESPPIPAAASPEATSLFTKGFFSVVKEEEDVMPLLVLPADVGVEVETPPLPVDDDDSAQLSGLGLTVFFEKTTSLQMQTQSDIPITAILLSDSPPADSPS